MARPRSNNLELKGKVKVWLENNQDKSELFLFVVNKLNDTFIGDNNGYVDKEPPEYRFNNQTIGGYTFVLAKNKGHATVEFMMADKTWQCFDVHSESDFETVVEFIKENKVTNFAFDQLSHDQKFNSDVDESLLLSSEQRREKIEAVDKVPERITREVVVYNRNPNVVAEVLIRANGVCESCKSPGPFKKAKDGSLYLEVHHKVRLADNGEDSIENAIALCPNCHRREHYG